MRSPGVIYRQYRKLRKKYLFEKVTEARKKLHKNCLWGKILTVTKNDETRDIPICTFDFSKNSDNKYEICSCPKECNAFCGKNTKDKILREFDDIIKNPIELKREYPDLYLFQWVLDKPLNDIKEDPPFWVRPIIALIAFLEYFVKFSCPAQKNLP